MSQYDHPAYGDHDDFGGLARDLPRLVSRRNLLALVGGGVVLAACGGSSNSASTTVDLGTTVGTTAGTVAGTTATTAGETTPTSVECTTPLPSETAGPFPGDGSNGPDVLSESGVVRPDITTSIGSASGVAEGVPLTITFLLQDTAAGCAALPGAAVYAWHCDREGRYSMYSNGVEDENYLRGVQPSGADGTVTFTSIFPGCYDGRWPHIHFEVYAGTDAATSGAEPLLTSQIAMPEDACVLAYTAPGYETSLANLSRVSLERDNVFGDDGGARQLGVVTGDIASGFTVRLATPV